MLRRLGRSQRNAGHDACLETVTSSERFSKNPNSLAMIMEAASVRAMKPRLTFRTSFLTGAAVVAAAAVVAGAAVLAAVAVAAGAAVVGAPTVVPGAAVVDEEPPHAAKRESAPGASATVPPSLRNFRLFM